MTEQKKRSIKKLFFGTETAENPKFIPENRKIYSIPCDSIRPNRSQPRACFERSELERLAASVKVHGFLQPLTVRKADIDDPYEYELVAGERRLRAAKLLELYSVPCIISEADDESSAELALVENLMRRDLNMFEIAYGLQTLYSEFDLTQEEIAQRLGMSQSAVANKLRLLHLSFEEQRRILELALTERHARTLLKLPEGPSRMSVIYRMHENEMTVKQAEDYINSLIRSESEAAETQEKSSASEHPFVIPDDTDKSTAAALLGFRRRVESINKSGKQAEIKLSPHKDRFELLITIKR